MINVGLLLLLARQIVVSTNKRWIL